MAKKRKIDFVLNEQDDKRLVFRFYPRQSNCHGFGNEPPKSWKEVYKVYYAYSILKQYKRNDDDNWADTDIVFECECDECSIVDEIAYICQELAKGNVSKTVTRFNESVELEYLDREIYPMGMGVGWTIHKFDNHKNNKEFGIPFQVYYQFTLYNWNDVGFRFVIKEEQIEQFGKYLESCCEYMLAHGEPI